MLRTALAQKDTAVELNQVKKHLFSAPAERQEKSGKVLITRGSGFMYVSTTVSRAPDAFLIATRRSLSTLAATN
jgi:hypothetical protein